MAKQFCISNFPKKSAKIWAIFERIFFPRTFKIARSGDIEYPYSDDQSSNPAWKDKGINWGENCV